MAIPAKRVDVQTLLSLGDDLLALLKNNADDGDGLMPLLEGARLLHSSGVSDANEIRISLKGYENKLQACEEKIEKSKDEANFDAELEKLQRKLDEKLQGEHHLQRDLRALRDEFADMEHQRVSNEQRKEMTKKTEKDLVKAGKLLSMCASVTNVIPDFEDKAMISGMVVDRNKKKVEVFEFDKAESPPNICNKLWKMA